MKATCHIIFCESNTMNIIAKFHKKIPNLSQVKGNTPHKVFSYYSHQSIIKNICAKFHKKPNGSQEIEKNTTKLTKKYPKMASRRGGLIVKKKLVQ